jgi:hypothetical protein
MSVLPSAAFIVMGVGGFHPVASSFEMSVRSSAITSCPSASRKVTTGGTFGVDAVSITYRPEGAT